MKEITGLLIFICIAVVTIYLSAAKRIDYKLTLTLLLFSILAGFTATNYDIIKRLKWGNFELEMAKKELQDAKNFAIQEIKDEIETQKESVELVIRDVNATAKNIETQKNDINTLVRTAELLRDEIGTRKEEILLLVTKTEKTKKEIESLNVATRQIALTLTKATYLNYKTRNELGYGLKTKKAMQDLENDLNRILPMVIPDPKERKVWVGNLESILEPEN
jgi:hypothetical protein